MSRVAVVTGGNRGIGRAIIEGYLKDGLDVAIIARDSEETESVVQIMSGNYADRRIKGYLGDISDPDRMKGIFKEIDQDFGQINILINNAGANSRKKISNYTIKDWDNELQTNLTGTLICSLEALHYMKKQDGGHIVNFSSIKGKEATSSVGYGASKSGIIGLTKSLAKQFIKDNVYVNAVAPGFINTGMTKLLSITEWKEYEKMIPIGRVGELEEVYSVVRFLTNKDSSYIVGTTIDVNGGYLMD